MQSYQHQIFLVDGKVIFQDIAIENFRNRKI